MNKKNYLLNIEDIINKVPIESRQKVADLGCGNFGYFSFPLADAVGREGLVYSVDILKQCLEEIKKRIKIDNIKNMKTVWSNLEIWKATKIESSSLDAAVLVNTLNQSDKRSDILRESVRLLKKKGKLLIVEWSNQDAPLGPKAEKKVKKQALIDAAPKLGLKLEKEFVAGPYHYGLVFVKI
ncbi:class I SAM-dependent methyltransferase [bacterium]|nr:class I SAM-dependent methyltransferase [bacterium]